MTHILYCNTVKSESMEYSCTEKVFCNLDGSGGYHVKQNKIEKKDKCQMTIFIYVR